MSRRPVSKRLRRSAGFAAVGVLVSVAVWQWPKNRTPIEEPDLDSVSHAPDETVDEQTLLEQGYVRYVPGAQTPRLDDDRRQRARSHVHPNPVRPSSATRQSPEGNFRRQVMPGEFASMDDYLWRYTAFDDDDLRAQGLDHNPPIFRDTVDKHLYHIPVLKFEVESVEGKLTQSGLLPCQLRPTVDDRIHNLVRTKDDEARFQAIIPDLLHVTSIVSEKDATFEARHLVPSRERDRTVFVGQLQINLSMLEELKRYSPGDETTIDLNISYTLSVSTAMSSAEGWKISTVNIPATASVPAPG